MYTLEGVSSVANFNSHFLIRSVFFVSKDNLFDVYINKTVPPIFVHMCVLCFHE